VVERTLSWFGRKRRLGKDFENLPETLGAFAILASIQLALMRLARAWIVNSNKPWLHLSMEKVCKSDGEGTFAGTHGNGEVAPIAAVPEVAVELEDSALSGPLCAGDHRRSSMPRPTHPQLQQVLANYELPAEVLLRRDEFFSARIAGHDMI
jgi:hypothetical protein